MKDFFSGLELKFLSLISDADYKSLISTTSSTTATSPSGGLSPDDNSRFHIEICRVCCHHKPNGMINIFATNSPGDMSYAQKIRLCVDVAIDEQDTLPKSICRDCAQNLEVCYDFQRLCRDSDYDLRRDKTLRDMIMEQVLDKTMGSSPCETWSGGSSNSNSVDLLRTFETMESGTEKGHVTADEGVVELESHAVTNPETNPEPDRPCTISVTQLVEQVANANCDIRKFQCDLCGARFFDIYNYKTHCRIHKIVKKYACEEPGCGKKFRTNVMLKIHSRTHTGERPFSCQTCSKTFKTASAVTSHQAVHATIKAFKCDLCPYEGTTKPNLRIHQRTHSKEQPYACEECGKRFSTASNLLKHVRNIHQRLKENQCGFCDKRFFSRESCRKHLITHTDSKPYECKYCPRVAYSWYSGLEKHYQKHHKRVRMPAESSFKGRVEMALTETLKEGGGTGGGEASAAGGC